MRRSRRPTRGSCADRAADAVAFAPDAIHPEQLRESFERAGFEEHWQALNRHHTEAYPESNPTPGDVAKAEAARLNELGLGDNPDLTLIESRVERVEPAVRITHVFEDRSKGSRFETEPFTGYD